MGEHSTNNMNETVIAFWNWTSITVTEEEKPTESLDDIFTLDISIIIVLSLSLVSIIFCCVLQRSRHCESRIMPPSTRGQEAATSANISPIYVVQCRTGRERSRPQQGTPPPPYDAPPPYHIAVASLEIM